MANTVQELTRVAPADLVIKQMMIPWSNVNRPGNKLYPAPMGLWMIQHTTGNRNDYADAESHGVFLIRDKGGSDNVSFHLGVDHDSVCQYLPLDEVAYHAGDGMDNYYRDVGGWGGIAMELCVNYDGGDNPFRWLEAKQRATATWAAVMQGDKRFNWGERPIDETIRRLSLDRYVPHRRVSDDLKYCPTQLLAEGNMDGWTGDGPMKEAIRFHLGQVKPPETGMEYPEGMDIGVARMLFGQYIAVDGTAYRFNEKGPVSQKWMEIGKRDGEWPEITKVQKYDTRTYFVFSNGMTLWQNTTGGLRELK